MDEAMAMRMLPLIYQSPTGKAITADFLLDGGMPVRSSRSVESTHQQYMEMQLMWAPAGQVYAKKHTL
eukprot:349916-Chlamydomonas_euryale.AAC.2